MKITFYGHACIGIKINDIHILVDPFISGNPKAAHIDIHTIPADYILLTHAHQDHILDVEVIAKRTGAVIVSNYEIASHFGVKGYHYHPMNHGGSWDFNFGIPMRTKLDLAILPIGSNFTMDVDDAIIASDFLDCDKVLGYHFDTFGYIEINHEEAKRKFFDSGKDLMLLEIGQSIKL